MDLNIIECENNFISLMNMCVRVFYLAISGVALEVLRSVRCSFPSESKNGTEPGDCSPIWINSFAEITLPSQHNILDMSYS